jgi:predicted kinase
MDNNTAYVMVGAPGSGKSTYTQPLEAQGAVVIGGDAIRAELYGNADIQGNWVEIHDRIVQLLEDNVGKPIVMDGAHYRAQYRKDALTLLNSYGYFDVRAIVINPPLEVCLERNAGRERKVPEHVIEKMHSSLQASLRGIDGEGFSVVEFADWKNGGQLK